MRRIFFLAAVIIFALSSCADKDSFVIHGLIKGGERGSINISRVDVNNPVFIDSAKINSKGEFKFRIKTEMPDFYQLGYSSADFMTLLAAPGEKIKVTFEGEHLYKNYIVEGSEGTEKIILLDEELAVTKQKLDSLNALYTKATSEPGSELRQAELEDQFTAVLKSQRKKSIEFIIKNLHSLASIKALYQRINPETYVLYDPKDLQYLKIVNDTLSKYYPRSKHVQALSSDFSRELGELFTNRIHEMASTLPETKLDPNLETVDGSRVALSSLRGKYVLLTFWSVRSSASVEENIQLKELYRRYNKQGFEIYQVNIDENEEAWRNAVKFDELPWISTREDDPANPLNVKLYNITSLPSNFLYDRKGNIIATNLHGRALQIKLDQLFN